MRTRRACGRNVLPGTDVVTVVGVRRVAVLREIRHNGDLFEGLSVLRATRRSGEDRVCGHLSATLLTPACGTCRRSRLPGPAGEIVCCNSTSKARRQEELADKHLELMRKFLLRFKGCCPLSRAGARRAHVLVSSCALHSTFSCKAPAAVSPATHDEMSLFDALKHLVRPMACADCGLDGATKHVGESWLA